MDNAFGRAAKPADATSETRTWNFRTMAVVGVKNGYTGFTCLLEQHSKRERP